MSLDILLHKLRHEVHDHVIVIPDRCVRDALAEVDALRAENARLSREAEAAREEARRMAASLQEHIDSARELGGVLLGLGMPAARTLALADMIGWIRDEIESLRNALRPLAALAPSYRNLVGVGAIVTVGVVDPADPRNVKLLPEDAIRAAEVLARASATADALVGNRPEEKA